MKDYRSSDAYRRSIRLREDGSELWPLTFPQPTPQPAALGQAERVLMRRAVAAGRVS